MIFIIIFQIAFGLCYAQKKCSITLQCLNGGNFNTATCKCECK